jgi:hypothetical protein
MILPIALCIAAAAGALFQEGSVVETGRALGPKRIETEGATVWLFLLDEKPPDYTTSCFFAAPPDLSTLTVLKGRVLQQIGLPEFKELRVLDLNRPTGGLWSSKEGLALHASGPADPLKNHEILLLDPTNLAIKSRLSIPAVRPKTSSGLSVALYPKDSNKIALIDLKTGKSLKEHSLEELIKGAAGKVKSVKAPLHLRTISHENFPIPTPDGKYLLFPEAMGLHRIRINGASLQYEEVSVPLRRPHVVHVSSDSKLILIWNPPEAPMLLNSPPAGTLVFKVDDLQKPVAVLPDVRPLGIDPAAGKIYGYVPEKALVVFSSSGKKEREIPMFVPESYASCMVHAEGSRLLVLPTDVSRNLLWIELSK